MGQRNIRLSLTVPSAHHIGLDSATEFDVEMMKIGCTNHGGGFHSVSYSGPAESVLDWLASEAPLRFAPFFPREKVLSRSRQEFDALTNLGAMTNVQA